MTCSDMTCSNLVSYYVPRGYDYREVAVRCGRTDPHGGRAICDTCQGNASKMQEISRQEDDAAADNAWLKSAGWGEI